MGKRILIAPDKFKGSLSGAEICSILKSEIQNAIPDATVDTCPLADGGDGSVEILSTYLNIEERVCHTVDPLGRSIKAAYYVSEDAAYIELASASGIVLLGKADRNPMYTSTYGTGVLIKDAIELGLKKVYLFLGGSSTNDGGVGIANALGYTFYDNDGKELSPNGSFLAKIVKIKGPLVGAPLEQFTICCDVNNPPFGIRGAAQVYGAQKGANPKEIVQLDHGIKNLCHQIELFNGMTLSDLKGGGAAGGTAICPMAFLDAEIVSGMDFMSEVTQIEKKIASADLIISGEGGLDLQSFNGKVVSGVADICRKLGKKLWLVVGRNDLSPNEIQKLGVEKVFSIFEKARNIEDAMENGEKYLREIGQDISQF